MQHAVTGYLVHKVTGTFSSRIVRQHIKLALLWIFWKEKRQSSFRRYCGLDLNPVDYSVWSILQEKVYKTRITDLDNLKHRIRTEWAKLDHDVIAAAVRQWRHRLSALSLIHI